MNWELIEHVALWVAGSALAVLVLLAIAPRSFHDAISRVMNMAVDVRTDEMRAMFFSALFFFFTLGSFFILRPIRDEMAVASGARDLPWMFAGTLGAMLLANPLYAAVVARFARRRIVTIAFSFFAGILVLFYGLWVSHTADVPIGVAFFVFTSVYNLIVVSVFWGVMADTFSSGQAKRLFGFIAVGGTLGSITGSALTAFLSQRAGVPNMLLISAFFLVVAIVLVSRFPLLPAEDGGETMEAARAREQRAVGGSTWAGIVHVFSSPYLLGIAGFVLLYTFGSTIIYFQQTEIIGEFFPDRAERTAVLARTELVVQILAALGQAFLTARMIRWTGLPVTLSAVAFVSIIGFAALGLAAVGVLPLLATFVVFAVLRRATEFSLSNPSRKVLFTVVSREDKYKTSSFLETFVYRLGDQLAAWGFAGLTYVGLTLAGISWITAGTAVVFFLLALWLGRQQQLKSGVRS